MYRGQKQSRQTVGVDNTRGGMPPPSPQQQLRALGQGYALSPTAQPSGCTITPPPLSTPSAPEGRSPSTGWRGPPGALPALVPPRLVPRLWATGALVPSMAAVGKGGGVEGCGATESVSATPAAASHAPRQTACPAAMLGTPPPPLQLPMIPARHQASNLAPQPRAPAMAAWDSLRTTVRRGCSAASPPGGSRGVPVTKRKNLRREGRAGWMSWDTIQPLHPQHAEELSCHCSEASAGSMRASPTQHKHTTASSATSPHRTAPALLHSVQLRQHLQQEAHSGGLQRVRKEGGATGSSVCTRTDRSQQETHRRGLQLRAWVGTAGR